MVVMAARTMGSNPGMDAFLFKVPAWVEAGRPLAAGHAILTSSIAIATYVQDQQPVPLKKFGCTNSPTGPV